jgi:Fic family protein
VVSHEKIIEMHKIDYYKALNKVQATWKSDSEDITPWLLFFLHTVKTQASNALALLQSSSIEHLLSPKQLQVWEWALKNEAREFSRKDVVQALGFAERTAEASIKKLVGIKRLQRLGEGKATRYKVIK